jgi:signal transduction histidine kinase
VKPDFSAEITAINLQRIWWIVIFSTVMNLAILAFNALGGLLHNGTFTAWQLADIAVSLVLLVFVRRLQKQTTPPALKRSFVIAFLALVLAFMDNYYFVLLGSSGHTAAYALGVITIGVLLLLPPRIFLTILLANHVAYCALLVAIHPSQTSLASAIMDGSAAVLVSALAAWFLFRAKINDLAQQRVIAESNRELQLRNDEMTEVMAITAHDLRSPLHGVKNLLDFAAPLGGPERLTSALQMASKSCGEMLALIGRLLDAHAANPENKLVAEDLRPHFELAAERATPLAMAKNLRVDLRLSAAPAVASIEAGSLAQVLDNLLGNAIKFSPKGAAVTVELFERDRTYFGEIRDEGPGIPAGEEESIFAKFHHGQGAESGSGLGLFIARKLMDSMHGKVRCVPQPRGTVFRLEFATTPLPAGRN